METLKAKRFKLILTFLIVSYLIPISAKHRAMVSGKIISTENKEAIDFATVYLKGTQYGCTTNEEGIYHLKAPAGNYTLIVSAVGYETVEKNVQLTPDKRSKMNIMIHPAVTELEEVVVVSTGVSRIKQSAFNAVAVDTKGLHNSTMNLSEAMAQLPGMKVRESGGVGSDSQFMIDGFSGKHVKIFIDGVPQEGVGNSFSLNNIPVNFAERIEVYKGVVPVGFGTDALGGVINIVTNKNRRKWFLDTSYSYGSFNTHKSYINFGQTFDNGWMYEVNAFQNYSDNNYYVDTQVEHFNPDGSTTLDASHIERVKRFNDTYHNEAIIGKIGLVDKKFADRLILGLTYSHLYKEIQTGVIQKVVFGSKHRKGYSVMPSLEYRKRNFLTRGLDLSLTANYNHNITQNIDTAAYRFNWLGEKKYLNGQVGEQSYQDSKSNNNNWNGTFTAVYHIDEKHTFTFNHVLNTLNRKNTAASGTSDSYGIPKETRKNITGLSYRLMLSDQWNFSAFGKYYNQFNAGPVSTSSTGLGDYVSRSNTVNAFGYGAAGTYFILKTVQAKLSYEKAYRLPSNEELFGDEDLELGQIELKPENSNNLNLNLSYNQPFGKHGVYAEAGLIYRNTTDYIQRRIGNYSGNRTYASYENHGRVKTKGYNFSARYTYSSWISIGGTFTQMDIRDNVKTIAGGTNQESMTYKARIPNQPYMFANSDLSFYWRNFLRKGNTLTVTYDNLYMHGFPLYSENLGSASSKEQVPTQFSHNAGLTYSLKGGRYNLSFECKNFTNEKLYDNFSLQKAGRAFYGKVRVYFGN